MSTNHESINSQPAPSVENQWSDLEKMGKSESRSESDFEEVRKETIQESQETKQAKLEELATKVREAYSNTEQAEVSKAQAGPEAKSSDIQELEVVAPKKHSLMERIRAARQDMQANRSIAKIEKLSNSKKYQDRLKLEKIAESGQFNFEDERVANAYLETVRGVSDYEISHLIDIGIPAELVHHNERIQSLTVDAFRKYVDKSLDAGIADIGNTRGSYSVDILANALLEHPAKEKIVEGLDIQKFGDVAVDGLLDNMQSHDGNSEYDKEYRQSASANLGVLKELGFSPSISDSQVPKLFEGYSPSRSQEALDEIGLIDGSVVDKMYAYKYEQTISWIKDKGTQDIPELIISENLEPGDNGFGNYWREQSQILGEDAMMFAAKHVDHLLKQSRDDWENNKYYYPELPEPKLEDFIDNGVLQDKFFEDAHGSPMHEVKYSFYESAVYSDRGYNKTLMRFLASNIDKIHGEDKGFIDTWSKIQGSDDKATEDARLAFMRYATGGHNTSMNFFDENGPTDNFFENAFSIPHIHVEKFMPLISEDWQDHFSGSELAYMAFCDQHQSFVLKYDLTGIGAHFRDAINESFDQDGPNQKLAEIMFESQADQLIGYPEIMAKLPSEKWPVLADKILYSDSKLLAEHPEVVATMSASKQQFVGFLSANDFPESVNGFKDEDIDKYFDDSGPKPDFWTYEFGQGDYDVILKQDEEVVKNMPFDDKQSKVLDTYGSIEDSRLKTDFKEFVMEGYDNIPISRIEVAPVVLNRLSRSNASEITAHRSAFAQQLLRLSLDDDSKMFESLSQIEDVFTHNNLPFVGKAFLSFQILHPQSRLDQDFDFEGSRTISPVLKEAAAVENSGGVVPLGQSREAIIFADMLKASFGSNNRSISEYLNSIQDGQRMLDELSSGQMSWDRFTVASGEVMSPEVKKDYDTLATFVQHMNTMYNNTQAGRSNPRRMTGNLQQDATELAAVFSPSERHSLPDRIVRSFAYFAGIKDFDSAVAMLSEKSTAADRRNREAAARGLRLEQGDFVKGIGNVRYLPNILQNGSVAKEFLGDSAGSDLTPLDTDLSIILDQPDSIQDGFDGIEANGYGPVWLVLKADENRSGEKRFSITRRSPGEANQQVDSPSDDKMEAFYTGAIGKSHYGIRTGFGSSEIDYFVTQAGSTDAKGVLDSQSVGLEVTLNGFYIPVVDKTSGKVVFTPDDYDRIRAKMSGLSYYKTGEYQFASGSDLRIGAIEINGTSIESVESIVSELSQNEKDVRKKHEAIDGVIDSAFAEIGGLTRKNYIDGDLTEGFVELIDTGSTGRFDNAPGSGDFDYMMRVDKSIMDNPAKLAQISNMLLAKFGKTVHAPEEVLSNGNLRLKGVSIDGLDGPVDIDISFTQKTNKVQYSTDMALTDRLETIRSQSPEKAQQVIANIIFAKKFLKAAGCYKPDRGDTPQGGLGGVGVENWVLQSGGSFLAAAREFMAVADKCESFNEFKKQYAVWDFGENHMKKGARQHDNFVADNMSEAGYKKMKAALSLFLAQYS